MMERMFTYVPIDTPPTRTSLVVGTASVGIVMGLIVSGKDCWVEGSC